jgi:hypothetical protein
VCYLSVNQELKLSGEGNYYELVWQKTIPRTYT